MEFYSELENAFDSVGIKLTEEQKEKFYKYYTLLVDWNNKMNLTAITDVEGVVHKHFLDSISIVKVGGLKNLATAKIVDIGTGAGFPGIPLKIIFPDAEILLLDSLNKRIIFLNEVIQQLGLERINCIHGRAEEFSRKSEYREQFDIVVSRAVARLNSLCELCIPFVKPGGNFVSYKALKAYEEIEEAKNAVSLLGGKLEVSTELILNKEERVLVNIKKVKATPTKYPRAGGKPLNNPL